MGKKCHIVYCDGSYKDGKGGWSFSCFPNSNGIFQYEYFGSCNATDSVQMELISCIKALANLPDVIDGLGLQSRTIEIRNDFNNLVDFLNGKENHYKHDIFGEGGLSKNYRIEFLDLIRQLRNLPYEVKAQKVTKKDDLLKSVDRNAKYALANLPIDELNYIRKTDGKNEIVPDKHNRSLDGSAITQDAQDILKWYKRIFPIGDIPTNKIEITEEVHLKVENINLCGQLKKHKAKGRIDTPIAVRLQEDGNYALVAGINRLCIAKMLGFETIPAFLCDFSHREFALVYGSDDYK